MKVYNIGTRPYSRLKKGPRRKQACVARHRDCQHTLVPTAVGKAAVVLSCVLSCGMLFDIYNSDK